MRQRQRIRPEANLRARLCVRRVPLVAFDRQSRMGKLHADLVRPARIERYVQNRLAAGFSEQAVAQNRFLCAGFVWLGNAGGKRSFVFHQIIGQRFPRFRLAGDDSAVAFFRLMRAELLGEPRGGFARFCKTPSRRRPAVEPVNKPRYASPAFRSARAGTA